jgi:hypothetical protein
MAKIDDYIRNYKGVAIKLSDGSDIKGKVNIGDRFLRLSDLFKNSQDTFIIVVTEETPDAVKKVYFVNRSYIVWARAED